jgi:archaellum component FlaF (FlaF/FlaG flagellin family)
MGFSVTIASSIVLIGIIVAFASISTTLLYSFRELNKATNDYLGREQERLDVRLDLDVNSVDATSCNVTVKNLGSKTIFLTSQDGFQWNTVIVSYENNSQWRSYLIENYEVLEVRVSGMNATFNAATHRFINPGEEAQISFSVPQGAPDIPSNGVVNVVFVTHYGISAKKEVMR